MPFLSISCIYCIYSVVICLFLSWKKQRTFICFSAFLAMLHRRILDAPFEPCQLYGSVATSSASLTSTQLHHPDKNPDDVVGATKRFQQLVEAYTVRFRSVDFARGNRSLDFDRSLNAAGVRCCKIDKCVARTSLSLSSRFWLYWIPNTLSTRL